MKDKNKNWIIASLIAALITLSILIFKIPTGFNGGYIHLGDVFVYIGATILPWNYAFLAAAIGGGLADLISGGMLWVLPTVLIKGGITLFFTSKDKNIINNRNIIALIISAFFGVGGYYLYGALISGNLLAPLISLLMEMVQPVVSGIIFLIIGKCLDKINFKNNILK